MSLPSLTAVLSKNGLILLLLAFLHTFVSCSGTEEKKGAEGNYASSPKSAKFIDEMHSKFTDDNKLYKNMAGLSLAQMAEIHTYCNIERWNQGINNDRDHQEIYESAAKALNIPSSRLADADQYFIYHILHPLDTVVHQLYGKMPGIKPDAYNALDASAFCGLYTISTELIVYDGADEKAIKEAAAAQANSFIADLPEWVTGVKFTGITRKDTVLQTSDEIDAGFIWKRGGDLREMKASRGFGLDPAAKSNFWDNPEWNERKTIQHPAYRYLTVAAHSL